VRELRAVLGISQEELSYRCAIHRNHIGAIERGEVHPTFSVLLRLLAGLDVSMSRLADVYDRQLDDWADAGAQAVPVPTAAHDQSAPMPPCRRTASPTASPSSRRLSPDRRARMRRTTTTRGRGCSFPPRRR
jgi:transcriptional regulator with XRE-family HTH domain